MSKQLNFFTQPYGALGIPNHARAFGQALIRQGVDLNLIPVEGKPRASEAEYGMTPELKGAFKRPNKDWTSLCFWYPNKYPETLASTKKNIGYYVFEYTIIPKQFIDEINGLDAICVPSNWHVDVLKNNGVTIPCHVIPGGVDPTVFNSKGATPRGRITKFVTVGKWESRKNIDLIIKAFNKAFQGDNSYTLTLLVDNPHVNGFNARKKLDELKWHLESPVGNIKIANRAADMASFYRNFDVAVFAPMAEGIGLPITEAMACGLTVIAPDHSGISSYVNSDNCVLLQNFKKVPVYDPVFFPKRGEFGEWNMPLEKELIDKLRAVGSDQEASSRVGQNAESYMRENFTWDHAAKKFIEELL